MELPPERHSKQQNTTYRNRYFGLKLEALWFLIGNHLNYKCINWCTYSTPMATKINKLLQIQPRGVVLTSSWLSQNGYSPGLLRRYRNSDWLVSIGNGAMVRAGETITIWGGVHALQHQLGLDVHPGGKTALAMAGKSHFLGLGLEQIHLFGKTRLQLPGWFRDFPWSQPFQLHTTSVMPEHIGTTTIDQQRMNFRISGLARAMMECLLLARSEDDLVECKDLMLGLNNLDPETVMALLTGCSSVKVKRLFLFLAEQSGHAWFKKLDISRVDLGSGTRSLADAGTYVPAYKLIVPRVLTKPDGSFL